MSIRRVLPFRDSAAVVLEGGGKNFLIFVGLTEGAAMIRELAGERAERPLTHDLVGYIFAGFDIEVQKIVLSSIVEGVFCATLSLVQQGGPTAREVRLDVRASDSMVLALKMGSELFATRRVLDAVEDVTGTLGYRAFGGSVRLGLAGRSACGGRILKASEGLAFSPSPSAS